MNFARLARGEVLDEMSVVYDAAAKSLRLNALHAKKRYNLSRETDFMFKPGDRVLLLRVIDGVHPKAKEPTQGPYTVSRVLPHDRYILCDLHTRRMHNVVHVSRMLPFNKRSINTSEWMIPGQTPATAGVWPVKSIVGRRLAEVADEDAGVKGKTWQYKIRWVGYGEKSDTWRSRHYLAPIMELVIRYDEKNPFPTDRVEQREPLAPRGLRRAPASRHFEETVKATF